MNTDQEHPVARQRPTFRATLVRVMIVQVVTLVILWILQSRYGA
jgi:negative regulator of sigma E activity